MSTATHWTVVREVISATDTGAQVMGALPGLVRRLRDEEAWREFATPDGRVHHYDDFAEFVQAEPPKGLGGRVTPLIALCGSDKDLAEWVGREARVAERVRGLDGKTINAADNHSPEPGRDIITTRSDTDGGTSADYLTRRIVRDYPEIAERMKAGEFRSVRAAALEAGIVAQTLSVRVTDPASVARSLRKHMTPEQIAQLVALLMGVDIKDDKETP